MCENPKSTDAVHQPAKSLLLDRASIFCSRPRKRNSSGQAVKKKIPSEVNSKEVHARRWGANARKCIAVPKGMAMQPNTRKLPSTKNPQLRPQPIEYPIPSRRRNITKAASATFNASNTVNTEARRALGYGHTQFDGPNFTATQTPSNSTKSCQVPAGFRSADAARTRGTIMKNATAPTRGMPKVFVPSE